MQIREENRNLILLATVALLSAGFVGILNLVEQPAATAVATATAVANAPAAAEPAYRAEPVVRVVSTPFVPNPDPQRR